MTAPVTAEELRAAQVAEYGSYVATGHIYIDGGLAFIEGNPVPAGHVSSGVVSADQVKSVKSSVSVEKKG